jgi:putative ABC transport system permease protein
MLLLGASQALVRLTRPLTRSPRFAIRHAVISLGRPGNQTRVILLAVGLGCFFILGVRAVQSNLLAEFDAQLGGDQPDLILIDIQRDQADGVQTLVAPFTRSAPRLLPLMRGRVAGVDGQHLRLPTAADVRRDGRMTREYGMTHRDGLEANERVVAGRFWSGPAGPGDLEAGIDTEVSVEREMRDDTGIALGDLMRFDVAGQILTARVTSVRAVQWDDTQSGGFVFVLRPSPAVAAAPGSFVGFLNLADGTARGTLQRDLVMAYPNVSAIDLREVLASIRDVVEDVTLGVTVVGAVTLVGGILILIGAVAMTKFQRLYEAAIFKTLGAKTGALAAMYVVEYSVLGLLAGAVGASGAIVLTVLLTRQVLDITWTPLPLTNGLGMVLTAALVLLVGVGSSVDVLRRKPLLTLRSE